MSDTRWHNRLTLRHFRMLESLERLGLVARVAEALNVSQPAISKQITELEQIVGRPVVTRDRNRLYLTPVGVQLARHARQVLTQIERAALDIDAIAAGISGTVSVGVVGSVAPTLMPQAVVLMGNIAPNVNLSIIEGHFNSMLPLLNDNSIDYLIARAWQPQEYPGIAQRKLYNERLTVAAGPAHPLARSRVLSWTDAMRWPWIFPHERSIARQAIASMLAQHGLAMPEKFISSVSLMLNMELLKKSKSLTLFPESFAQAHAQRGDLVILPVEMGDLLSEVRCYWRTDMQEAKSTVLFLQCLSQSAAQLGD
ncbi:LysR substrate-binding domain-containing protein [Roseinatronobacter alkalisoli]|uniref:LysR substrate-binding domain-containing protein n=1 Tax=Roseinatronobacter alkalisoli TaxID=3028235 RepID=A0ABT5TB41_9RHOB|nr:LysR substrate-binding domain-containing protein [Roseinatronobacter sp. HJB301]MDD7972340.1 LysR substrate-binding domain-containing protein [Roseinatronobacter sp. HJB301]